MAQQNLAEALMREALAETRSAKAVRLMAEAVAKTAAMRTAA